MMFGNLFGGKKRQATPAPQAQTANATPRPKGAFGRFFGEYGDGSNFFDRASAAAAFAGGDYGAGAGIRNTATTRAKARKDAEKAAQRQALYATPFARFGGQGGAMGQMGQAQGGVGMPEVIAPPITPQSTPIDMPPMAQFDANGRPVEQVTVTGQRMAQQPQRPEPEPFRVQPNQIAAAYRERARLAAGVGDVETFQQSNAMADKIEDEARKRQGGMIASQLAPLAMDRVSSGALNNPNDPSGDALAWDERQTNGVNDTIGELGRMGVQLTPTQIEALRDPATRSRVMNQLINAADPERAVQAAIDVNKSRDEFRPFQRDDSGSNLMSFDPSTGRYMQGPAKSVDPNERFRQGEQTRREAMGNSSSERIAANSNAVARLKARIDQAQGAERIALERQKVALEAQGIELQREFMGGGSLSNAQVADLVAAAQGGRR